MIASELFTELCTCESKMTTEHTKDCKVYKLFKTQISDMITHIVDKIHDSGVETLDGFMTSDQFDAIFNMAIEDIFEDLYRNPIIY